MADERPIGTLVRELNRRAGEGFKHAPFQMAFWVGLVLCGGLGIWFEVYHLAKHFLIEPGRADPNPFLPLRTAIATFYPAILGATSLQMAFEDEIKSHRGAAISLLIVFLLLLFPTTDRDLSDLFGIVLGTVALLASLWVWCAANGTSASWRQSPDAPVGDRDLAAPLSGEDVLAGLNH